MHQSPNGILRCAAISVLVALAAGCVVEVGVDPAPLSSEMIFCERGERCEAGKCVRCGPGLPLPPTSDAESADADEMQVSPPLIDPSCPTEPQPCPPAGPPEPGPLPDDGGSLCGPCGGSYECEQGTVCVSHEFWADNPFCTRPCITDADCHDASGRRVYRCEWVARSSLLHPSQLCVPLSDRRGCGCPPEPPPPPCENGDLVRTYHPVLHRCVAAWECKRAPCPEGQRGNNVRCVFETNPLPTATCTATPVDQAQIGAEQSCQINEQGFCNLTICGRVNDRFAITGCGTTDPTRETAPVLVGGGHNFYFDCTQPPNPRPCELKAVCAGGDEWSTTPTYDSEFSCYEAAENFFEHFYCGKIVNGECIVVHQEVAYDGVPLSGYGACPEP